MKSKPKSQPQKQQEPQPSLQDKVAQAQASQQKWSQLAADPTLSPQAAQYAKNLARSYAAAQRLGDKALAYQDPSGDQQAEQDPMLTRLLQLPLGSSIPENPSSSTKPETSA
jgi:hypothetical protein